MKANLCPILPYGCYPLMSNRIILLQKGPKFLRPAYP